MKHPRKFLAVLCAAATMAVALVAVSPAEAKDPGLVLSSPTVAIYPSGSTYYGKVFASCKYGGSRWCTGKVWWKGDSEYATKYALRPGQGTYLTIRMTTANQFNPYKAASPSVTTGGALYIDEAGPYNRSQTADPLVRKIERKKSGVISGTITGAGSAAQPTNLRATLLKIGRDQNTVVHTDSGSAFSFTVPLGVNNTASGSYLLRVRGTDQFDNVRSWYWRGGNGYSRGGTKWDRDATRIRVSGSNYAAPVTYGSISGHVSSEVGTGAGTAITVAAPPRAYPGWGSNYYSILRELDIEACGNVFSETKADGLGNYAVGFLPVNPAANDEGYMVKASKSAQDSNGKPLMRLWNNKQRSCLALINYPATSYAYKNVDRSDPDLIGISGSAASFNPHMEVSRAILAAKVDYTATAYAADRTVTIRERLPYRKILDSPVLAKSKVATNGDIRVYDLPPGQYWVEVGRTTQCKNWVPSRFPNNSAYLQGEDRASERWKTVDGKYPETQKSYDMGYVAKTPPSGFRGWMWRDHCPAVSRGRYTWKTVTTTAASSGGVVEVNDGKALTVTKGAWITGHVSRIDGKTNKEMLVIAYVASGSNYGSYIPHYAITNGSGNFKITGLPSGTYRIRLNTDSWRGIGRNFSGTSAKSVTAGKGYSVGTLRAKF